jgi:hypothetical protein
MISDLGSRIAGRRQIFSSTPSGCEICGELSGGIRFPLPLRSRGALQPPATFYHSFGVTDMARVFAVTDFDEHAFEVMYFVETHVI